MEPTARSTDPIRPGGRLAAARALAADLRGASTSVQMLVVVVSLALGSIVAVRNLGGAVSDRSRCAGDQIVALDGSAPCNDDGSGGPGQDTPAQPAADEGDGGDDQGGEDEQSDEERDAGKELLDLILDITGVTDAVKCFTEGDIGACVFTVLNFTPGKIFGVGFKLLANIGRINKLIDRLAAARKAKKADEGKCTGARCDEPDTCFAPGTLIVTAAGMTPIEELRVGDQVWSRSEDTGEEAYRPVVNTFVTPDQALLAVSLRDPAGRVETLEVTAPHPFQVEGSGWVKAGELVVGDRVASAAGAPLEVVAAGPTGRTTTVYNVEVEEFHTYFVGEAGAWVHNDCKDKDAPKKNKKTGEKCKGDGDCATGHCHSKRNGDQVCVDCSKKEIGDFLGIKDRFCKNEPRSCSGLSLDDDIFEFESRINSGDRCIGARNAENQRCFRGADPGHQTAVKEAEKARANCKKRLDEKLERDTAPGS